MWLSSMSLSSKISGRLLGGRLGLFGLDFGPAWAPRDPRDGPDGPPWAFPGPLGHPGGLRDLRQTSAKKHRNLKEVIKQCS